VQDDELFAAVAEALRSVGLNAGTQDTGGGTECVVVASADRSLDEPRFWFGTAGEHWAAEVEDEAMGIDTDVPSSATDPNEIAAGILSALARMILPRTESAASSRAPIRCPRCGQSVPWERMNDATHFRIDCPQTKR
jgi:hypothetical protein